MIGSPPRPAGRPVDHVDQWLSSPPTIDDLGHYAALYRKLGWVVLPCAGKVVNYPWKTYQARRPTPREFDRLLHRPDVTGLAVLGGWVSGWSKPARKLCVRDFDALAGYARWADRHPDLAATLPTVRTARGVHVYCWSPFEVNTKLPDGELRASSRCYVLAPPSLHPDGVVYGWLTPIPLFPDDLLLVDPREAGFLPVHQPRPISRISVSRSAQPSVTDFCIKRERSEPGAGGRGDGTGCGESANLTVGEREVVAATLPDGPGERNARVFDLARRLKALPHLADAAADDLEPVVKAWWHRALPVIRTKDWATTWAGFRAAWGNVEPPAGDGPLKKLMRAAADTAADPAGKILAVCWALQDLAHQAGADWFFLSCRTAAAVCGCNNHVTAARWLKKLVRDGVLELVEQGVGGTDSRRASRYRVRPGKVVGRATTYTPSRCTVRSEPTPRLMS